MAEEWREPLHRLGNAGTLPEAQAATARLMDAALPGGAAVASDAADIALAITSRSDVQRHRFRAYLLWILVLMRSSVGVWQAALDSGGDGEVTRAEARNEGRTIEALTRAATTVAGMMDDPDPEVRSVAFQLVGAALQPAKLAGALLIAAARSETDELARACAIASAVVALARQWPDATDEEVDWVRDAIRSGTSMIQGRVRRVVEGHALVGSRQAAASIVAIPLDQLPPEGPFWPVESV
jgi:hypothetical protein